MTAANFKTQPWKHPVNWTAHIVSMRRETIDGAEHLTGSCECGWSISVPSGDKQAGYVARDDAIHAHWTGNIEAAEKACV